MTACFAYRHVDRQPLGDMGQTIAAALAGQPQLCVTYHHTVDGRTFCLCTRSLENAWGVFFADPCAGMRLSAYITEELREISKKV